MLLAALLCAGLALATTDFAPLIDAPFVSANELKGPCRAVTLIFARGSTEPGNIGIVVGPSLSCTLKQHYGTRLVATQGVDYPALISGNYEPQGCNATGIKQFATDIHEAATKCPHTKIVAGGFSQGASCLHAAFRELDPHVKQRVAGVVTFGDPRNKQDNGQVPGYPKEKTKIFCDKGDPVCAGELKTTAAHRSYFKDAGAGGKFLIEKIGKIEGQKEKGKGKRQEEEHFCSRPPRGKGRGGKGKGKGPRKMFELDNEDDQDITLWEEGGVLS